MKESKFQLEHQRLIDVEYKLNDKFSKKGALPLSVGMESTLSRISPNKALLNIKFFIFKDEPLESVPIKAVLTIEGLFTWASSFKEEEVVGLLEVNAPAVLMSYIRPIITQLTVFSGLPALILPLLDFTKSSKT